MPKKKKAPLGKKTDHKKDTSPKVTTNDDKTPPSHHYERMLNQIVQRERILRKHFSNERAIEAYIDGHNTPDLVRKRIKSIVASKSLDIKRLAKDNWPAIEKQSDTAKFITLSQNKCVKVEKVFPEILEGPSLCDLFTLYDQAFVKEDRQRLQQLQQTIMIKIECIRSDWRAITGSELDLTVPPASLAPKHWLDQLFTELNKKIPQLGELDRWKAPLPTRPAWSNEQYSLEARRMGHRPALDDENRASNRSIGNQAAVTPDASPVTPTPSTSTDSDTTEPLQKGEGTTDASTYLNQLCDINNFNLYDRATLQPLAHPNPPGRPRHTFPGPLYRGEDIFYDYSVILPVPECGPCRPQGAKIPRTLTAAKVIVGKAKNLLDFLSQTGLAGYLGTYNGIDGITSITVYSNVDDLLNEISLVDPKTLTRDEYISQIRGLRNRLHEMAGLIRLVSRMELFPLHTIDFLQLAENVLAWADTLNYKVEAQFLPAAHSPWHNTWHHRVLKEFTRHRDGETVVYPEDKLEETAYTVTQYNREWPRWPQAGDLRPYLHEIGVLFGDQITPLLTNTKKLAQTIKTFFTQPPGTHSQQLIRGTTTVLNTALLSLSDLLQQIAAQLTIPKDILPEGSSRLALQLIFRQYWHPESYVQGKLVGHKNLLPNQKETLKRRTFVKTTRETSTVEEFATARQDDYSHSQKETAQVIRESANKHNFSMSASGGFNILVAGGDYKTTFSTAISNLSKTTQNITSEAVQKGSAKYSEKREVKIRELSETEDVQEMTTDFHNMNAEITANYFYYQLLRQYCVTIHLHDLRPVLLYTRDLPSPAEIDELFISTYIHILIHHLPSQLSADAQEGVGQLNVLTKKLLRHSAEMDQRSAEFEAWKHSNPPPAADDPEKVNRWREEYRSRAQALSDARDQFIETEEEYSKLRGRMDRVITHLRENICYYMQFIWQDSPKVDHDKILQEELFCGEPLPSVTRGLIRQGYFGNEEIFDYTGRSIALFVMLLENLTAGSQILSQFIDNITNEPLTAGTIGEQSLAHRYIKPNSIHFTHATINGNIPREGVDYGTDYINGRITFMTPLDDTGPTITYTTYERLAATSFFQYLRRYYATQDLGTLLDQIDTMAFVEDPLQPEQVLSTRRVQIAQDALVVETMPGQVPLLEGFQMAHRMLNVQQSCLENVHLAERIVDRPWTRDGSEDSYEVHRYDGTAPPSRVVHETE